MELRIFEQYSDASCFAKSLAKQGIEQSFRRNGSTWVVEYGSPNGVAQRPNVDIEQLLGNIDAKEKEIESLKERNEYLKKKNESLKITDALYTTLQEKYNTLHARIQEEVSDLTQEKNKYLENIEQQLLKERSQVKNEKSSLSAQRHRLDLLEKKYVQCFGEAEVKIVIEKIISTEICSRCSGDGGVKGGCQKCDGIGWIDVTEEISTEVVEIKE